jgi:aspartyl-tRNA synthetase
MVSGFDRYYQIARCMRDEDLRADRQPEFSQIDLEMSFIDEEVIYELMEGLMAAVVRDAVGRDIEAPFPRLSFLDAMNRFGSDKPDLRFEHELFDVTEALSGTEFRAFSGAIGSGGVVKAFRVPASFGLSRKDVDGLEEVAKLYGAKGLARAKVSDDGALESGIAKFLGPDEHRAIVTAVGGEAGDLVLMVADRWTTACNALGSVRLEFGKRNLELDPDELCFVWVNDFTLFEEDPHSGSLTPAHHIFTMPREDDLQYLDTDPTRVRGQLYDLVLNGVELGSGSIRVHRRDLQERLLRVVGMPLEEADRRFGFLLKALEYGAPPHGGIALGLERIVMILAKRTNIRDTIAFPKTTSAASLMDGAPGRVEEDELVDLHLRLKLPESKAAVDAVPDELAT